MTTQPAHRSDLVTIFDTQDQQGSLQPRQHDPSLGETSSLRNSCDACAQAKLKCKKEKPSCSRCTKRGIPCIYLFSKRAGRKPSKSGSSSEGEQPKQSQHSPALDTDASFDCFGISGTNHSGPSDLNLGFSELMGCNTINGLDLTTEDIISDSTSDLYGSRSTNENTSGTGSKFSGQRGDSAVYGAPMDVDTFANTSLPDTPGLDSLFSGPLTPSYDPRMVRSPQTSCLCMQRALQDMQKVTNAGTVWSSITVDRPSTLLRASLDVVKNNKEILRGMIEMLSCQREHNGHLPALLAFVLSGVINLYAALTMLRPPPAFQDQELTHSTCSSSSTSIAPTSHQGDYEDPIHAAAYIIFGELQQIRKLHDQLGRRLRDHARSQESSISDSLASKIVALPTAKMCYTLEADLSTLLEELALAVVQRLT
ncbi:hypothetical protein CKM354_001113800 [Cercospora kikuchii]|uniref:Zn(2)-C6 fungal-type domain-containing protein n=1 Tax=Cercospora kikuchii TaxID=84275 RepID=A0A9P3FHT1_9PEZI|nr:uncharacterized protein CKM354_001113800 [Cercospora kikuchii]GIZ48063.1 hypothetical protein CKM354_001113800 [Cercospora kikuchii]